MADWTYLIVDYSRVEELESNWFDYFIVGKGSHSFVILSHVTAHNFFDLTRSFPSDSCFGVSQKC